MIEGREKMFAMMLGRRQAVILSLVSLASFGFAAVELPSEEVVNGDFESTIEEGGRKAFGWNRFGKCYRVERSAGENGSSGLVWRNDDPECYEVPASPIRLVPGCTYEIKARFMTIDLKPSKKGGGDVGLCVECKDASGKFTKGIYQGGYSPTDGRWRGIYQIGKIPLDAVTMTVSPVVAPGSVGEVHFDSISVERVVCRPVLGLYVDSYRDEVFDRKFDAVAGLDLESAKVNKDDYEPILSVQLLSGGEKEIKAVRYDSRSARFSVDALDLPMGRSKMSFVLKERKTGKIADGFKAERIVERLNSPRRRKVCVDRFNRIVVDGKPFFPLGLYWNKPAPSDEELARYAKGPFNCLLNYQQPTKADLDACHRHGLMAIYTIEGVASPGSRRFPDEASIMKWTRDTVERHKNHPALLAWYMNDERSHIYIPQMTRRHSLVRGLDDDHPTYTVLYQLELVSKYMDAFDIIGTDPYPIGDKDNYEICSSWARAAVSGAYGIRPVWQVPQVFDWGAYHKHKADKTRQPTVTEMKNMFWQAIACGANGLVGYSYFDLEKMKSKKPMERAWAEVCEAAAEIKRFFPVFLSEDEPPAVSSDNIDVPIRAWRDGSSVYILAVNSVNTSSRAKIRVKCDCGALSAVLGVAPAFADDGSMVLELPALGVSLWRMKAPEDETTEIQSRIDAIAAAGGGRVDISSGDHHVRSLLLRSGVELHLAADARLIGSRDPDDYEIDLSGLGCGKNVTRRWSNAIIRIVNAHDVAITGERGSAIRGRNCYDPRGEEGFRGPHAITAFGVTNLALRGYAVFDAGNFGIYAQECSNVLACDVAVNGGHDGFDFFRCRDVTIERCRIFSGDDCVAGYNNEHLTVRGCELNTACSFFRIGGNGVLVEDCRGAAPSLNPHRWSLTDDEKRLECTPTGAGRRNTLGVFTFFTGKGVARVSSDIVFRNCRFEGVDRLMHYNLSGGERWQNGPGLAEVSFEGVVASGLMEPLTVYGMENCLLSLQMKRCTIGFRNNVGELFRGAYVGEFDLEDVSVSGAERLFLNYGQVVPKLKTKSLKGVSATVEQAADKFSCRPI